MSLKLCNSTLKPHFHGNHFYPARLSSRLHLIIMEKRNLGGSTMVARSSHSLLVLRRRCLSISILTLLNGSLQSFSPAAALSEEPDLEQFIDTKEGFTLLKPRNYKLVDKAGATVLFEEVDKGGNTIGVVVSPVRLNKLAEFGSPEFVADKLIQAEKRKESTKSAEVIAVAERSAADGGLQVYEFEYTLDSSRGGMKRVFSAAFVASKKLYLLNIVHSDRPESPLNERDREILEEVIRSFDTATT